MSDDESGAESTVGVERYGQIGWYDRAPRCPDWSSECLKICDRADGRWVCPGCGYEFTVIGYPHPTETETTQSGLEGFADA